MLRKTALITAGSVAAVVLTGTVALGANLAAITADDDQGMEDVTPAMEVIAAPPVALALEPAPAPTPSGPVVTSQEFTVDRAGAVTVEFVADELWLDSVSPASAWQWTTTQSSDTELDVTFTNGEQRIRFVASLNDDGSLAASVDEFITEFVQDPPVIVEIEVPGPSATAVPAVAGNGNSAASTVGAPAGGTPQPAVVAPPVPSAVPTAAPSGSDDEFDDHDEFDGHEFDDHDEFDDHEFDDRESDDHDDHESDEDDDHEFDDREFDDHDEFDDRESDKDDEDEEDD